MDEADDSCDEREAGTDRPRPEAPTPAPLLRVIRTMVAAANRDTPDRDGEE